jgi:AcrR family transcriptional regulator
MGSSVEKPGAASHRENKRVQCRTAILDAAEAIFAAEGFGPARMIDIAQAAGISEKTLFNYFASKPLLLEALTLRWFEANNALFAETETVTEDSVEQVLPPALDRRLSVLAEYRWLLAMTAQHTDLFVTHRQPQVLFQLNFDARLKRVHALQKRGVVRTDVPAAEICDMYQALRNHLLGAWLTDGASDFKSLQKKYQRAMSIFLRGIAR